MATQKLFYENVYQTTFTAQVRSCTPGKHGYDVVLDQTCFYPEGGGQPWDTGTLNGVRVTEVHERGGEVVHCCEAPLEGDVTGCVDWDAALRPDAAAQRRAHCLRPHPRQIWL